MARLTPHRRSLCALLKELAEDCRGVAAVEMAIVAPLLVLLLLGTAEAAHLIKRHFEVAQTASTVADVVARYENVTKDSINAIFDVSERVMGASTFRSNGRIILSSVAKGSTTASPTTVSWQCSGGGTLPAVSAVGKPTQKATLPGGLVLDVNDNVIVAEVFFKYEPLFRILPLAQTIQKRSLFRPRLGALTTAPGC
jgi:Flp pilus assembly protein TadG